MQVVSSAMQVIIALHLNIAVLHCGSQTGTLERVQRDANRLWMCGPSIFTTEPRGLLFQSFSFLNAVRRWMRDIVGSS
jgi:hypothetical protein